MSTFFRFVIGALFVIAAVVACSKKKSSVAPQAQAAEAQLPPTAMDIVDIGGKDVLALPEGTTVVHDGVTYTLDGDRSVIDANGNFTTYYAAADGGVLVIRGRVNVDALSGAATSVSVSNIDFNVIPAGGVVPGGGVVVVPNGGDPVIGFQVGNAPRERTTRNGQSCVWIGLPPDYPVRRQYSPMRTYDYDVCRTFYSGPQGTDCRDLVGATTYCDETCGVGPYANCDDYGTGDGNNPVQSFFEQLELWGE